MTTQIICAFQQSLFIEIMSTKGKSREHDVEDFFNTSGAGLNHTRCITAPLPSTRYRNVTQNATELHIDLFNFDDPKFENSKYVLTSPRSLEACSRLSVKPVEILYKPLIEFQEELVPRGISMRAIYETFDQQERERLNKLQLCREERDRIVVEDKAAKHGVVSPVVGKSRSFARKAPTLTRKSALREQKVMPVAEALHDVPAHPTGQGSVQRARTAWTTSIGHDRVSPQEIDRRAKEIHAEGMKKKTVVISTKSAKSSKKPKLAPGRKKQQRELAKQQQQQENGVGGESPGADTRSVSSSRVSRPWIKDPKVDATPITDPLLRQKLSGARGSRVSVRRSKSFSNSRNSDPPLVKQQDQKILQLMLAKREQEKRQSERRETAHSQWEAERKKEDAARISTERVRKNSMAEDRRKQEAHRGDILTRRQRSIEERRKSQEEDVKMCDRKWASASQRQAEVKRHLFCDGTPYKGGDCKSCGRDHDRERRITQQRLQEKKALALERRKCVGERLEQQKKEMEDLQREAKEKADQELRRANSIKDTVQNEQAMRLKLRNYHTKKRQEERMNRLKRQSMEELSNLRASSEMKQRSAEQKLQDLRKSKEDELRRQSRELDKRIKASKKNQKKIDGEIDAWHEDLLSYRKVHEKKAEEIAKENVLKKKQRAAEERAQREQLLKDNLQRIQLQEDEWKQDLEATIALKESRAKMLQMEKDEMIQESRALAQSSQRLREELRQHYSMNDLDKWNKEAELTSRIINKGGQPRHNGLTKPMSNMWIG